MTPIYAEENAQVLLVYLLAVAVRTQEPAQLVLLGREKMLALPELSRKQKITR